MSKEITQIGLVAVAAIIAVYAYAYLTGDE